MGDVTESLFDALPRTDLTVDETRSRLAGYHFGQEAFDAATRDVLYIAEGLLRLVDDLREALDG